MRDEPTVLLEQQADQEDRAAPEAGRLQVENRHVFQFDPDRVAQSPVHLVRIPPLETGERTAQIPVQVDLRAKVRGVPANAEHGGPVDPELAAAADEQVGLGVPDGCAIRAELGARPGVTIRGRRTGSPSSTSKTRPAEGATTTESPTTATSLAKLYEADGRLDRAADMYRALSQGSDRERHALYHYEAGRLLHALGLTDEARRMLTRADALASAEDPELLREDVAREGAARASGVKRSRSKNAFTPHSLAGPSYCFITPK